MTSTSNKEEKKTVAGAAFALLAAAFIKFKSVMWLFSSFGSMILSIGVFSMMLGLPYALSVVLLLYIHEGGHWIWMKALGLQPKAPMFIPGLGAFVAMTKLPQSEALHAWVALAGPLVGGLGCAILFAAGMHLHNNWLMASGNTGFMLNLLQLIPAKPLDGGFVVQAISRWILIPGTLILFLLGSSLGSPILLIIALVSLLSWGKKKRPAVPGSASQEDVPVEVPAVGWERVAIAFAYMGLVVALGFGYFLSIGEVTGLMKR